MFDVIIIGAGPAGMTAAMYAKRRMMKVLVISKNIGGQVIWASDIKNYPGIEFIKGVDLIGKMSKQVKDFGVDIVVDEVKRIAKNNDGSFLITANQNNYHAKTIIAAIGLAPKKLHLPKENEFIGQGISYCATCDGPLFKGKDVAVVGGGNSALDAADVMSKIANKVYLIYRGSRLKAFESLVAEIQDKNNVEIMLNSEITEILGGEKLEKIKIINNISQNFTELNIQGLFIEIGHGPETDILDDLVATDDSGQIIVDFNGKTSCDGIFAAGDVTQNEFKQISISCGQGATAALSAYKYLQTKH